ncbi:unnamed protein product [Adineta ricciae]|uniref:F-box domain-containing protein n=1 Tax=Adineta ricciae TaxID=249248 RepID=A0A816GCV4_ADIRI|nr:unnamed protein product [Adineta ricciae]
MDNYSFDEINVIRSYVPKLRFLSITRKHEYPVRYMLFCQIIFHDSTYFSLLGDRVSLEGIEQFVKEHCNRISVLHVSPIPNIGDREAWEKSIQSYIPHVSTFNFEYGQSTPCRLTYEFCRLIYTSTFGIAAYMEQKFFTHEPMSEACLHEIFCSSQLHRKKYFELDSRFNVTNFKCHDKVDTNSINHVIIHDPDVISCCSKYFFAKATDLSINHVNFTDKKLCLTDELLRILDLRRLTKLTMNYIEKDFDIFIRLLRLAPNIRTITWESIEKSPKNLLSLVESEDFQLVSQENRIKTITITSRYTKKMMEVLVHLCPRVQYISIGRSERSLDATVHYLLSEINDATLRLFSLCIREVYQDWMTYWKDQIKAHGVFDDYSIKIIDKNFYLWWGD